MNYLEKFDEGLSYGDFLAQYGNSSQQANWAAIREQVQLSDDAHELLGGFVREMKVMVSAGAWCGDCVNQCPIFDRFAEITPKIQIRFFDRDDHPDLAEEIKTCGGHRVPSVLFLSEDGFVCGRYGDKTLSQYRDLAEKQLGGTCPTGFGGVEQGKLNQITQEWLDEFERIQLMLRLSGRLRAFHND